MVADDQYLLGVNMEGEPVAHNVDMDKGEQLSGLDKDMVEILEVLYVRSYNKKMVFLRRL